MHRRIEASNGHTKNSNVDQGERKQEQDEHGEAQHWVGLAGDRRDGAGRHHEPDDGEVAASEECSKSKGASRDDGRRVVIVGHPDAG